MWPANLLPTLFARPEGRRLQQSWFASIHLNSVTETHAKAASTISTEDSWLQNMIFVRASSIPSISTSFAEYPAESSLAAMLRELMACHHLRLRRRLQCQFP
jgi:hypothetical protein